MPRKQHDYHFIYKTTNLINGKFYIGMHSTSDLNDGYIGSGKRLRRSINKYGKENFKMEILEYYPDRCSLKEREKDLVNEEMINNIECLNLKCGGDGGNLGKNGEHLGGDKFEGAHKYWEKPENKERCRERMKLTSMKIWKDSEYRKKMGSLKSFKGKKHKLETIEKMRKSKNIGEINSQFGTCWITNGVKNNKIKKELEIPVGWFKGRTLLKNDELK